MPSFVMVSLEACTLSGEFGGGDIGGLPSYAESPTFDSLSEFLVDLEFLVFGLVMFTAINGWLPSFIKTFPVSGVQGTYIGEVHGGIGVTCPLFNGTASHGWITCVATVSLA